MTSSEFTSQFGQIRPFLYGFALRLTGNDDDAKDLVQETAMRTFTHKADFKSGTNFKAWSGAIMRNTFISNFRKRRLRKEIEASAEDYMEMLKNKGEPEKVFSTIMVKELNDMLCKVPRINKLPFLLYFHGYRYDEIARHMQIPVGTVKSRIFNARRQIQSMIKKGYGDAYIRRA
jgi:RNA polymerase sigma-70 factor (ECF subfamily)